MPWHSIFCCGTAASSQNINSFHATEPEPYFINKDFQQMADIKVVPIRHSVDRNQNVAVNS